MNNAQDVIRLDVHGSVSIERTADSKRKVVGISGEKVLIPSNVPEKFRGGFIAHQITDRVLTSIKRGHEWKVLRHSLATVPHGTPFRCTHAEGREARRTAYIYRELLIRNPPDLLEILFQHAVHGFFDHLEKSARHIVSCDPCRVKVMIKMTPPHELVSFSRTSP